MARHMQMPGTPGVKTLERRCWRLSGHAAYPACGLSKARMDHIRNQIRTALKVPEGSATTL